MKTVRVDVRVHNERELKVVWNDDSAWLPYFISRKAVEDCAREIRLVLAELVNAALAGQLQTCGPILRRLAEEGAQLHQALFTKTGGETDPDRVRLRYERWAEPFRLRFSVSDSVFIPWGLVYSGDPASVPNELPKDQATAWQAYTTFWCLKRELSTLYDRIPPDAAGEEPEDSSTFKMVRVVHPETFSKAIAPLNTLPENDFLGWLKERYGEPLTSSRALKTLWREHALRTKLLYFYCHASATKLSLGDEEKIEASRLLLMLSGPPRPPGTSNCLVFLNGCSTAVGAAAGDFLLSTSQQGLCGFIGTETDIPDIFALRFSLALLDQLFREGKPLGEAMHHLYRRHFPLSLVYGIYAHPDFCMPQAHVPNATDPKSPNFSFGTIGSDRLEVAR